MPRPLPACPLSICSPPCSIVPLQCHPHPHPRSVRCWGRGSTTPAPPPVDAQAISQDTYQRLTQSAVARRPFGRQRAGRCKRAACSFCLRALAVFHTHSLSIPFRICDSYRLVRPRARGMHRQGHGRGSGGSAARQGGAATAINSTRRLGIACFGAMLLHL